MKTGFCSVCLNSIRKDEPSSADGERHAWCNKPPKSPKPEPLAPVANRYIGLSEYMGMFGNGVLRRGK